MGHSLVAARALAAALVMAAVGCSATHEAGASSDANSLRQTTTLTDGWRFIRQPLPNGADAPGEDSNWERVSLPHTWNAADGADGGSNYYRGGAWYRRKLAVSASDLADGRRVVLRFGAASLVAKVYLNGELVGSHTGGYAAFALDVTPKVRAGENVLAVMVDNTSNRDVPPSSGDFTIDGGLYRPVELVKLPAVHVSPLDDGGPGVYLTPRQDGQDPRAWSVGAKTLVRNTAADAVQAAVSITIRDAAGKQVARDLRPVTLPAGSTTDVEGSIAMTVEPQQLWDGKRQPYLFSATAEVWSGGKVVDAVRQPLGFRTFSVDAEKGFVLNGRAYDLHGVNIHQGRVSKGYADSPADRAEDYRWVDELGATAVRMAHYQHPPDAYDQCDRLGLVTWTEMGLVNRVSDTPAFKENARAALRELIKQNYNHPSVMFWSLYNEPGVGSRDGSQEQWRYVKELNAYAKELDPTRLTTGATAGNGHGELNWYMDATGMNFYHGWYGGKATAWAAELTKLRDRTTGHLVGIGEYGAGASIYQHEALTADSPRPKPDGKWHPEEWQALVHEQAWGAMAERPWLWCKLVWVMFDFPSDGRNEGDHAGINDKGLVTGDRKTAKDAFYFYQANWSDRAMLHVTDARFNPRPPGVTAVKVYSNCDDVRLMVGGKAVTLTALPNHVYTAEVDLAPGTTQVVATGTRAGKAVRDVVRWDVRAGAATRQSAVPTTRPK